MPLDPISRRDASGHFEHRRSRYQPRAKTQQKLDEIAASQRTKPPKSLSPLTLCYLSAFILPSLHAICRSAIERPQAAQSVSSFAMGMSPQDPIVCKMIAIQGSASPTGPGWWPHFPIAEATTFGGRGDKVKHDATTGLMTITGDFSKRMLFSVLKNFLASQHKMSNAQINGLEFDWMQTAASGPIMLADTNMGTTFHRDKRISLTDRERYIGEHITQNCAIETDIYSLQGENEGKVLILKAQRIENPFRMLYDNIPGYQPSPNVHYLSESSNFLVNVITLGLKPLIGGLIANYYRQKYYEGIGDDICATRQKHLSFAQLATALDVDGLHYPFAGKATFTKPNVLQHVITVNNDASIVIRNHATHVQTNLVFWGKHKGTTGTEKTVVLKPKNDGEFEAIVQHSDNSRKRNLNIIYDKAEKIWRYDETGNTAPIDITVSEGESYITMFGENYPLRITHDMQYEIIAQRTDGVKKYIPVYMDALTKNWHLKTQENHPFYSLAQQEIINKLKVEPYSQFMYHAIDNLNPRYYKEGKIFEVRNRADNIDTTPPLYNVVEMNGKLVPIRITAMEKHGVRYTAYNIHAPLKKEYPLEWHEGRWRLERSTSPHVSHQLAERIMPDMFAKNIKERNLSTPDQRGIKWTDGRGFLKVRGKYVEIHKGNVAQIGASGGKILFAVYKEKQFQPIASALWNNYRIRINNDWQVDGFFDALKSQSKEKLMERIDFFDIVQISKSIFTPISARVEVTSSDALDKKRFVVTVGSSEQFVVETSLTGENVNVLKGMSSELALSKYRRCAAGGDIDQISTLRREAESLTTHANSRQHIDALAHEFIASGTALFSNTLNNIIEEDETVKTLIVGHADFFHTSTFENNIFTSSKAAYKAMSEILLPLSREHPNTVIIPGSIYISQDIPEYMLHSGIRYAQHSTVRKLKDTVTFSTTLVPVLYKGKFVAIARKGEYLTYITENTSAPEKLTSLDIDLQDNTTLIMNNMAPHLSSDTDDVQDVRVSTLFTGKTLLPRERGHAGLLLLSQGETEEDVERLFSNEFMIDDNKFLLIVDDEFIQHGTSRPTVRTLACPLNEDINDCNHYDWIIHSAGDEILDDSIRATSYNYLRASAFNDSELLSDVNHRTVLTRYSPENRVTCYEFVNNEEYD